MSEENKATTRRFMEEVINKGNFAVIDEVIAPDCVDHNPMPGQAQGPEGAKQAIGMLRTAFPDLRITIEDMVAEGDKVAMRGSMTGTQNGEFMGIAPTGKSCTFDLITIDRFRDGKVVEHWEQVDMMGMMQQLGVTPTG